MITTLNKEYAVRFAGVAALLLAFAGWFIYDGAVGYPGENARVAPVAAELAARKLSPADWMNTARTGTAPLTEAFRAKGFDEPPAKIADTFSSMIGIQDPRAQEPEVAAAVFAQPIHTPDDIRAQFVSAAISAAFALLLLAVVGYRACVRFELDGGVLRRTVFGTPKEWPLTALTEADDSQWKKRAILRVAFGADRVTLDAWHYAGIRPIAEALLAAAGKANPPPPAEDPDARADDPPTADNVPPGAPAEGGTADA